MMGMVAETSGPSLIFKDGHVVDTWYFLSETLFRLSVRFRKVDTWLIEDAEHDGYGSEVPSAKAFMLSEVCVCVFTLACWYCLR